MEVDHFKNEVSAYYDHDPSGHNANVNSYMNWTNESNFTSFTNESMKAEGKYLSSLGVWLAIPEWEAALTAVTLSLIIVLTVVGNILVILSVFTYKPLRSAPNFFIVSLAVADLTVAVLVLPLNVAHTILGRWVLGKLICEFWVTSDVLCCTASILHLCAIALDRYRAITDPINYARKRTLHRVLLTIALVWIMSFIISSPPLLGWNDWPADFDKDTPCALTRQQGYVIYSALGSFFIPLLLMTGVYIRIFIATRRRLRQRASRLAAIARQKSISERKGDNDGDRSSISSIENNGNDGDGSGDHCLKKNPRSRRDRDNKNKGTERPSKNGKASPDGVDNGTTKLNANSNPNANANSNSTTNPERCESPGDKISSNTPSSEDILKAKIQSQLNADAECLGLVDDPSKLSPANVSEESATPLHHRNANASHRPHSLKKVDREGHIKCRSIRGSKKCGKQSQVSQFVGEKQRISLSKERKAARTMGIIMGVFVVCWLPFFLMYVIVPFCADCEPSEKISNFITWLGYVNSSLNPIIYTIFNMDFRKAFKKLLHLGK